MRGSPKPRDCSRHTSDSKHLACWIRTHTAGPDALMVLHSQRGIQLSKAPVVLYNPLPFSFTVQTGSCRPQHGYKILNSSSALGHMTEVSCDWRQEQQAAQLERRQLFVGGACLAAFKLRLRHGVESHGLIKRRSWPNEWVEGSPRILREGHPFRVLPMKWRDGQERHNQIKLILYQPWLHILAF